MTRKHFEVIASTMRKHYINAPTVSAMDAIYDSIISLAEEFVSFNPRFDKERFINACTI